MWELYSFTIIFILHPYLVRVKLILIYSKTVDKFNMGRDYSDDGDYGVMIFMHV